MNYYDNIKEILVNNEITKKVKDYSKNKSDLDSYYNVGKLLVKAQGGEKRAKYGDGLIKEYSKRLTKELGRKYSYRNLMNMRKFYLLFKEINVNALRTHLTWTHFRELMVLNDKEAINYYIYLAESDSLSYRQLHEKIKLKEYERLSNKTKIKLINEDKTEIEDFVKHPIVIKNNGEEIINERILQKIILENITAFLRELGDGFSFIENEYRIKIGDSYNYIDLLLFNYKYMFL